MVGAPSPPGGQTGDRDCDPQIDSYEKLYEEVSRRESTKVFHGWLQCDCRPFKQALLNTIQRWSLMFKRHLSNHVISRWAPTPGGTRGAPQGHRTRPSTEVRGVVQCLPQGRRGGEGPAPA